MSAEALFGTAPSKLGPAQFEAINVLVGTVADEENRISFPIDPNEIAALLGIDVTYGQLPQNVAGAISKEKGDVPAQVVINQNDAPVRQRFTLAHEIGHFVKHAREDGLDAAAGFVDYRNEIAGAGSDRNEIFANKFAAELLAPAFAVRRYWAEGKTSTELQSIFNLSKQSMEIRLSTLGLV